MKERGKMKERKKEKKEKMIDENKAKLHRKKERHEQRCCKISILHFSRDIFKRRNNLEKNFIYLHYKY